MERDFERKERRNGRVKFAIVGLKAEEVNATVKVEEFLKKDFGEGRKIINVRRQGTTIKGILLVKMDYCEPKQEVLRNKSRLDTRKVYVSHDLSYKEREIQREIK